MLDMNINFDATALNSMSVYPEEVEAVKVEVNDTLYCKGKAIHKKGEPEVYMIVDRLKVNWSEENKCTYWTCTMVRQTLSKASGQNYIKPEDKKANYLRNLCKKVNAEVRIVRGGIPPLTREDELAVPCFKMNGTKWFILKRKEK